ncbi:hypothetical protein B0J11DRAFT_536605 [Dendryphion nanum]|uniref:C3H1-type domain-containing protein n=1 Tax=Dendryphion nanum TaxID=256645 RepID=A0A9P9IF82_9PLEO|nr:hypothetical protein B0J11DRAFT_536605 [Dendryphion nanum]
MVGLYAMANDNGFDGMPDFAAHMEAFQRSDDARQRLLATVLEKYEELVREHTNLKNDYASERDIRRNYQSEVSKLNYQYSQIQLSLDSSSFVLALIDGDGVIFQDALLSAGANGGSEAASKLQYAIREHITSLYTNSSHWPIMVHVYLSLDKLAQKLAQVGILKHPQDFRAFAQSFGVNQPLFSIIDVGQGKERADHRIKEMLRTFSDNPTCRQIIFGGCHDTGYLLNLDQYKHNQAKAERITLLESTNAARGFAELPNFMRVRFNSVFKSEPLPDYVPPPIQAPPAPQPQAQVHVQPQPQSQPQPPSRTLTNSSTSTVAASPITNHVKYAQATQSPSLTNSALASPPADASWATVGKTGVSNGSISIAPKNPNASKKKYVYYNKDGYRLDEPLPPRDRNAAEAIEKRMDQAGRNLCNHWHLNNGKCQNGDFCKFQHAPKLSVAELNALRYKTRSLPCKRRDCENFECYLGHQCSFERDQGYCPFPDSCNLRVSHGMDKTKYERWDEDGNAEYSK